VVSIDAVGKGKPVPTPAPQPVETIPTGVRRAGVNSANHGFGIGVAVIDTGIDLTHPDLNVVANMTCIPRTKSGNDDNGHGTHVAGTIAALDNEFGVLGVASQSDLYAVKVLDKRGSGSWSSVICGIDWVTENAQALNIKVANMSLGGSGYSDDNCGKDNADALHQAICTSTAAGITYVVAAGMKMMMSPTMFLPHTMIQSLLFPPWSILMDYQVDWEAPPVTDWTTPSPHSATTAHL